MESNVIESVTVAGELVAADFSVWSLFLRADIVVKLVMLVENLLANLIQEIDNTIYIV